MSNSHYVGSDDEDIRLDRWFKRHFPNLTHGNLEKRLRKGDIRVDGVKAKSSDRIKFGQEITLKFDPEAVSTKRTRKSDDKTVSDEDRDYVRSLVIFENEQFWIVNKPRGLASQGGTNIVYSLDSIIPGLAKDNEVPKLTHRLDRDTSGCLIVAKNAKAASALMNGFAKQLIHKTYLAVLIGAPLQKEGIIELPLAKHKQSIGNDYEIMQVDHENGKKAATKYRVVDNLGGKFSLIAMSPLTGRTHQLRVHMQAIGCPILGDPKYGYTHEISNALQVKNQLHLHSYCVEVPSINGSKAVTQIAPLPEHMNTTLDKLGVEFEKSDIL